MFFSIFRIHDFGENKTKPLISKMKDAGNSQNLIFHSSAGVKFLQFMKKTDQKSYNCLKLHTIS